MASLRVVLVNALLLSACRSAGLATSTRCDGGVCDVECAPGTLMTASGCQLVLESLTASPGRLEPAFDPLQTAYAVEVPEGTSLVDVTATTAAAEARVSIDGQPGPSRQIAVRADPQRVTVRLAWPSSLGAASVVTTIDVRTRRSAPDAGTRVDGGAVDAGVDAGSELPEDPDGGPPIRRFLRTCRTEWALDAGPFPRVTTIARPAGPNWLFYGGLLALSDDGTTLFVGDPGGWNDAMIFRHDGGAWVNEFTITDNSPITSASLSADGTELAVTVPFDDVTCSVRQNTAVRGAIRFYARTGAGWRLSACVLDTPRHPYTAVFSSDMRQMIATHFDLPPRAIPTTADWVTAFSRTDGGWVPRARAREVEGSTRFGTADLGTYVQQPIARAPVPYTWPRFSTGTTPAPTEPGRIWRVEPIGLGERLMLNTTADSLQGFELRSWVPSGSGWREDRVDRFDGGAWSMVAPGPFRDESVALIADQSPARLIRLARTPTGWSETSVPLPDAGISSFWTMQSDGCQRTFALTFQPAAVLLVELGP